MADPLTESDAETLSAAPTTSSAATLSDATVKLSDLQQRGLTHFTTPRADEPMADAPEPRAPPMPEVPAQSNLVEGLPPEPVAPTPAPQRPTLRIPGIDPDPVQDAQAKYADARQRAAQSMADVSTKFAALGLPAPPDDALVDPGALHSHAQSFINRALASPQANQQSTFGPDRLTPQADQLRQNLKGLGDRAASAIGDHADALSNLRSSYAALQSAQQASRVAPPIPGVIEPSSPVVSHAAQGDPASGPVDLPHETKGAAGESIQKPFAPTEQPFRVEHDGSATFDPSRLVAGITAAHQSGALDDERFNALLPKAQAAEHAIAEQQKLLANSTIASKLKALGHGATTGAAFLAGAPIGAEVGAGIGAPFGGIGAPIGAAIGGAITGGLASWGAGKILKKLGEYSDTIQSFNDAAEAHPNFDAAGNLISFSAGLPKLATNAAAKGLSALAGEGEGVIAKGLKTAAGAYEKGSPGALSSISNLAEDSANRAAQGASLGTRAAATAARVGGFAGANVALDTAIKTASHAMGLGDGQTVSGAAQAAIIGGLLAGHGISFEHIPNEEVADIMSRGVIRRDAGLARTESMSAADIAAKYPKADGAMVHALSRPLSAKETEIYNSADAQINAALNRGENLGPGTTVTAKQALTGEQPYGNTSAKVTPASGEAEPSTHSPTPETPPLLQTPAESGPRSPALPGSLSLASPSGASPTNSTVSQSGSSSPPTPVQQPEQGQNEPPPVAPEIELAAREKELAALRADAPPWHGDVIRGRIKMLQQIIEDQQTHEPNEPKATAQEPPPAERSVPAPQQAREGVPPSQISPSPEGRVRLHLPGVDEPLSTNAGTQTEPSNKTPVSPAIEPKTETTSSHGESASPAPLSSPALPTPKEVNDAAKPYLQRIQNARQKEELAKELGHKQAEEEAAKERRAAEDAMLKRFGTDSEFQLLDTVADRIKSGTHEWMENTGLRRVSPGKQLAPIAGPALIDEQGNILHRGELGQTHTQLKIAAAKNGVDATEATHAFHVEGSDKPLSRTEAAERALQTGQIDQATFDRAMSRTKDRGLHSQDLGAPPSEPIPLVESVSTPSGGKEVPPAVAEKPLRVPGLPEKPLTGEQARRVRALNLIATKRELRPAEKAELAKLQPQDNPPSMPEDNRAASTSGQPSPSGPEARVLYRAADKPEAKAGAHFSEKEQDAKQYQDNPGFGGSNLFKYRVDDSRAADLSSLRELAQVIEPLMDDSQRDWANENGGLAQVFRDNGYTHVFQALENSFGPRSNRIDPVELLARDHDWIRFTDDFPEGAKTWRYIGDKTLVPNPENRAPGEGAQKRLRALKLIATKRELRPAEQQELDTLDPQELKPDAPQKQRPRLGDTVEEVWNKWKEITSDPSQHGNSETIVARSLDGEFFFGPDGELRKSIHVNGVNGYKPATKQQEFELRNDIAKGTVQIERQQVKGMDTNLYKRVGAGQTNAVLHQATGAPLQPQESLSNKPDVGDNKPSHEPTPTADESERTRERDNRNLGDAGGTEVGRLAGESGEDGRGSGANRRSIDRVGKFLRRDGGHGAHLKRLGATLRHVEPSAAPGGMAMTPKGELLYSKKAIDERLHKLAPAARVPFGQTLFIEELIHRSHALIEGKRLKVENAKIWAVVKRDPVLAALVTDAYRSAHTDSQKGEEFLRMLVLKRQGFPLPESFYRDTRQLETALAKPQDTAIEATAEKIGQVLLHGDVKEFPDASVPREHPPAHGEVDESPSLNEILGGDEIYHGESPDSLVGKAVDEAVEHLSPEQRGVLDEIRKGKSVDQIAKAMGVQPATIKGRLSEANQALDKARDAAVSELADHIRQYEPDPLHDLQARVRTLASTIGSKMGLARAMMRAATLGQQQGKAEHDFIDRQKIEIHKLATEIINDALPVSERARFLDSLGRVLSTRIALRRGNETVVENLFKRAANIASNVLNRAEELRKEAVVQAIKKTATRVADSPSVDVVYKATIHDKIKNLDFHRPAARTVSRLTGTKDYIEGKEQAAETHAVPQEVVEEIDRLNKLPIRDLPAHVLDHMLGDMLMLEKLGRLKVKTRAAVKDSRRQFALGEMTRAKTTPLNFNPIKVAQPGSKLTVPDAFRNKVNKAMNRAAVIDRALLPMAAVADALGDGKGEYRGALERHVHGPIDTAYNSILVARDELLHPLEDLIAKHNLTEQDSQKFAVYATLQQADGEHRLLEQGVTPETIAANRTLSPQLEEVYAAWQSIEKAIFPAVQKVARDEFNQHVAKVEGYFPMLRDHDAFVPTQAPIETAPGKAVQYDPMAMLQNLRDDFNPVPRKNAEAGFTKERVKGAGTPIRLDGFEVIRRHVNDATHFIHMQPVLNDISAIVGNPVFVDKYGQGGQTIYRDYIDTIARQGGVDATKRVAWLDTLRRNLGLAAIGFRLASNIKHASNVGLAMFHAGPKWYAKGFKAAISGEANEWISKHMAEIKARHGAEPAQEEIETGKPVAQWAGKASVVAQKYAFFIARNIDAINAKATAIGAYMAELSAAGRDPDNYLNEPVDRDRVNRALLRMRRAVASPNPKDQPQALTRGTGLGDNASIAKTLLAFQNVFLDQWSNLRHDFARAGIKEKNPRIALMMGLAILATTLIETGIEHFVRQGENAITGTPEDPKHPEEFAHSLLVNGLRRFPFMGQIMGAVRYGGSGIPVVDSLLVTPFKQVSKLSADNPTAQTKAKAAIDLAKTAGGLIGVPGIGYAGDMLKKVVPKFIPSKPTRASVVDEARHGDAAAIQKALEAGTIKPDQVRAIQRDAH